MTNILGIPMYDSPLAELLSTIRRTCSDPAEPRRGRLVSLTGAHGLVHARHHAEFRETLEAFDYNLPDGLPGVWVGRYLKGATSMEQIRGADFFRHVMSATAADPIRHYLCGGKDGVAERLAEVCAQRFGNANVCGTHSPPFRPMTDADWDELVARIDASGADIVWVGLSTPKQELFARELAKRVRVHYLVTIGAAFDFHTGAMPEAPRVLRKAGLEWAYRTWREPRRLARRYAEVVPLFLLYNALDMLGKER